MRRWTEVKRRAFCALQSCFCPALLHSYSLFLLQRRAKGPPKTHREASKSTPTSSPTRQNCLIPYGKRMCLHIRLFCFRSVEDGPRGHQDGPKIAQEAPKSAPRRPRRAPRRLKSRPREPKRAQRWPPTWPKSGRPANKRAQESPKMAPKVAQEREARKQESPREPKYCPQSGPRAGGTQTRRTERPPRALQRVPQHAKIAPLPKRPPRRPILTWYIRLDTPICIHKLYALYCLATRS